MDGGDLSMDVINQTESLLSILIGALLLITSLQELQIDKIRRELKTVQKTLKNRTDDNRNEQGPHC